MDWNWNRTDEQMPAPGIGVLAYYRNSHNKGRIVKAAWIPDGFEESEDSDFGEYDAERDAYFFPEGWYEQIDNWDVAFVPVVEGIVTRWMEMPEAPHGVNQTEPAEAAK